MSHQLRLARDLPQVIINFDEQVETELTFTVIWLRVLKFEDASPIQEVFEKKGSFLKFVPDRIKHVGLLRKKYPKEVTVFRVKFDAENFLRTDHSVDLFKARQAIVQELQRLLGDFRDYNGGMIAKQHEQFIALKQLLSPMEKKEELLLENFFHSIFPVEHRSVFNPLFIKEFFLLFLEAIQSGEPAMHRASCASCSYVLLSYTEDPASKEKIIERVKTFQISSSQLLGVSLEHLGIAYLGYIYFEEDARKRDSFILKLDI